MRTRMSTQTRTRIGTYAAVLSALTLALVILILAAASGHHTQATLKTGVVVVLDQTTSAREFTDALELDIKVNNVYSVLINGFSACLTESEIEYIRSLDAVEAVYSDVQYSPLSSKQSEYKTVYAPGVEPDTDITRGRGSVVAVLDDGFYLRSEVFTLGDDSYQKITDKDISGLLNFTRASRMYPYISTKKLYKSEKIPFAFDYADSDADVEPLSDHGTAMLSIAVGYDPDNLIPSAAPSAQALAMKVYSSKTGTASSSAIAAALEDAYILGADSVCLSLGTPCGYTQAGLYDMLVEKAISKLYEKGIVVACAAGNNGALGAGSVFDNHYGYYEPMTDMLDFGTVNAPSTHPSAISVTSADAFSTRARALALSGTEVYIPYSDTNAEVVESGSKSFLEHFGSQTLEYVPIDGLGAPEDYIVNGRKLDLTGKIALVKRGELSFVEKVNSAAQTGALAVIIYDNQTGDTPSIRTAMQLEGATLPAIFISQKDGERMLKAAKKSICTDPGIVYVTDAGITPSISKGASRGPSPELDIKPELAASGTETTTLSAKGKYMTMSGSSVAAAYTAGAAASIAGELAEISENGSRINRAEQIKLRLMNTARPMTNSDNEYYSVTLQGAGYISPGQARSADTLLSCDGQAKILLGNMLEDSFELKFTLENLSASKQSYSLSALIGTEDFECVSFSELCSEKDPFYKRYGIMTYDYLGKSEDDEIGFVGEYIYPFRKASVMYGESELNLSSESRKDTVIELAPGEKRDIVLGVTLDKSETELLAGVYKNGMYVQGYIFVENLSTERSYSMPYLGFRGDFFAGDPFDASLYEKGGLFGGVYLYSYHYPDGYTRRMMLLGAGGEVKDVDPSLSPFEQLAVISPCLNGADSELYLKASFLRNLQKLKIELIAPNKETVSEREISNIEKAYLSEDSEQPNSYSFWLWDFRDENNSKYVYDDGEYVLRLTGTDAAKREYVRQMSFVLDSEKPEYLSHTLRYDDSWKYLDITVSDNTYIKEVRAYAFNEKEVPGENNCLTPEQMLGCQRGGEHTASFNITNTAGQYVYVRIIDAALNERVVRIDMGK